MEQRKIHSLFILFCLLGLLIFAGASCSRFTSATPEIASITETAANTLSITTPFPTPIPSQTSASTPTPTGLLTPTPTRVPAKTLTPTPTYSILRGQVLVDSSCNYGPGVQYLFKYLLIAGSNLEIIGRTDLGDVILVRAIGGTNPCWVKSERMDVQGDVMSVAPTYLPLPQSPYYGPLKGVVANRNGSMVTVSWTPLTLREGDDSGQYPYLIEAWVCRNGKLLFTPIGTYQTSVKIRDEPGCLEPSHARVTAAEKHGYTQWVEVPWSAAPQPRCRDDSGCD